MKEKIPTTENACEQKKNDCTENNPEVEILKYKEAAEKAEAALKEAEDKYLSDRREYWGCPPRSCCG